MTAILTAVILFVVGILVGGLMVESQIKRKLRNSGFVIIGGEIYLFKKVTLVDISEINDE